MSQRWHATRSGELPPAPTDERTDSRRHGEGMSPRDASFDGPRLVVARKPHDEDADWSLLMVRAQDGDGAAYARLLKDVTPYLRSLAAARMRSSSEVEDAVQDVLLTVHRLRHTYDPHRPIGPWLATIARRRIIDRLRMLSRRQARETALTPVHETFSADPANGFEENADRHALNRAIDELPPGQREAVRLLKLEEMSLREASALTGTSVGALKVAMHRALKNLKTMIADWNE